jgi:hypothetical protein
MINLATEIFRDTLDYKVIYILKLEKTEIRMSLINPFIKTE